ncbi:hypothetical protein P3T39_005488 [Kitasatospora sp. GP82]|nr:hypothetical protein [Kitasatospora sp. GP82]
MSDVPRRPGHPPLSRAALSAVALVGTAPPV